MTAAKILQRAERHQHQRRGQHQVAMMTAVAHDQQHDTQAQQTDFEDLRKHCISSMR
ncbi:hypothetical protein SOM22_04995 [Stenotrophomonas rhizophila]|uniref:hypothetical protein n=1 Tax=Stenotrophomonas rhizophila TaxID=216778 RepID=UPI002A69F63D|nr:hypothetical protein [Stenotrophomonas rhizophila]MDY0953926.1 hypothetical protein [Stenotrophomonas rhizophila]